MIFIRGLPSGHQTSRAVKSPIGVADFPSYKSHFLFVFFSPARGYPPVNQHRCGKAYHLKILFLEKHGVFNIFLYVYSRF